MLILTFIQQSTQQTPAGWAFDHIHTVTWPVLTYFIVRACIGATRFIRKMEQHFARPIEQVNHMATNCFPTMQGSLQSIDTNIKVLVDRRGAICPYDRMA